MTEMRAGAAGEREGERAEVLPDGTFVLTTYGHWTAGEPPYIVFVRLKLAGLDALARPSGK